MWVFSEQGFFSVVEDWKDKNCVYVRARWKKDLENLLTKVETSPLRPLEIITTPERDYPFRIHLTKSGWAKILSSLAGEIDYGNFKGRIAEINEERESIYMRVWSTLRQGANPSRRTA